MPIIIDNGMLNQITGDTSDGWDGSDITYALDVDYGNLVQDVRSFFHDGISFDPDAVPTSSNNLTVFPEIIQLWSDVIAQKIVFEPGDEDADITVETATNFPANVGGSTYTTLHTILPNDADVFVQQVDADYSFGTSRYQWSTLLHEFGHALGLQHPGNYDASDGNPTYDNSREFDEDTAQFSIMSYFDPANYDPAINWDRADEAPQTPMVYDILAIQAYYGVDTTTRLGDTTYGFNSTAGDEIYDFSQNTKPVLTIWDAGGDHDRLDVSGFANEQRIDLNAGSYSDVGGLIDNVAIAFGVTIEDAIGGSGSDNITGNDAANHLVGNDGNDVLSGGAGNDTLEGGNNDDQLNGDLGDDFLDGGKGNDVLHGGADNDVLRGGDGDDFLYGEFGVDTLDGGIGNDYLDGGGSLNGNSENALGPDVLTGGLGDDTFVYMNGYRATVITDFSQDVDGNSDTLDLSGTLVHSFSDLLSDASQHGADTVFDFGANNTLTLQNFSLDTLTPDQIGFSEPTTNPPNDFLLTANPTGNILPYYTYTAPLSNGGFVGVILDNDTYSTSTIKAQVYDSRGVAIDGDTIIINSTPMGASELNDPLLNLQLISLTDGKFVAAWNADAIDQSPTSTEPFREIRARVFNADGTPLGPDFVVNATPPVIQQNGFNTFSIADLQATPGGGFTVDWLTDVTPDNTSRQVQLYRHGFDGNGNPVGSDIDLGFAGPPLYHPLSSSDPRLYFLSSGGILKYWQVYNPGNLTTGQGAFAHAYAQLVGQTGVVQLDQGAGYVPLNAQDPDIRVSELADGRILFTYGEGSFFTTGGFLVGHYGGSESVIYDSNLQGFTKPGTSGDDVLQGGPWGDRLYGLDGDDTLSGGAGADLLDGGPGNDTVSYLDSLQGVDVDLTRAGPQAGGHAEGDILVSIENIIGSSYGDNLAGDEGANVIDGGYGNDYIFGAGGADQLHGGPGDDHVSLQGDGGTAWGDAGKDTLTVLGGTGNALFGGDGQDTLNVASGTNNDLHGGDDIDDLGVTDGNNNFLFGEAGNDHLHIEDGSGNAASGGEGNDEIDLGGDGSNNTLDGGAGDDKLLATQNTGTGNVFHGGAGDDEIEGNGNGIAQYSGFSTDYTITVTVNVGGDTVYTIADNRAGSPDGTDTVIGVAKLQFSDKTFDIHFFDTPARAADGYIVGATVFADANNDGVLDAGDSSTTTNATGGFTLPAGASGPLVLTGGIDVGTGLSFGGKLLAPAGYNIITPLTTIIELLIEDHVTNPGQTALANLGLDPSADTANLDPIIQDIGGNAQFEIAGIQVANTVDLIASAIDGAYPGQFGNAYGDAFHALASAIGAGSFDITDRAEIAGVINATMTLGHFNLASDVASGLADIIAGVNGASSGFTDLPSLDALEKVAQGDAANAVKLASADPSTMPDAIADFTDDALLGRVTQLYGHAGDIDGPDINNAPAPRNDSYVTDSNQPLTVDAANGVLANDVDFDGDTLTATLSEGPEHGSLSLHPDGSFTYAADAGYAGADTFKYAASDGTTETIAAVDIEVDPGVTGVTASFSGTASEGDVIDFTVTMSSVVIVREFGLNRLVLELNDGESAQYLSGSGTDTLIFRSDVLDGDSASPLAIVGDDNNGFEALVVDKVAQTVADLSGAYVTFDDITVACYCPGTLILAEHGEVPVEQLVIGDRLRTRNGQLRPVKWIGRRGYGGRFIAGRKDMLPICFKTGSLGEELPRRDLWISPHHAMYLDGVLIEAKDLVNGVSIVQAEEVDRVEYFHIELDSHDVILAEGAWSETFIDDDSRSIFHNAHEFDALYPNAVRRPARYCAPRLDEGYELEAVRRRIARHAGLSPHTAAAPLRGCIDRVGNRRIEGWAQNVDQPDAPVCLDIYADGRLIGQTLANLYREDLRAARLGDGHSAFVFVPPAGVAIAADTVEVRRSFDGAVLGRSVSADRQAA